ncbi:MAG: lysine--tRNA ligase [Acidobacteriota bacterium]
MSQYESPFEENLYELRREKLAQIAAIACSLNPALSPAEARYPNHFRFTASVPELRALGAELPAEKLQIMHLEAAIAGRIVAIRIQGKAGFAQIQQQGQRLQIYVRKDDVGEAVFNLYKLLDLGDHIGVRGFLMRTRTGELTLHAAPISLAGHASQPAITFLAKAMLALPDKFHGLEDIELRYRRRYLDLFTDSGEGAASAAASEETAAPTGATEPVTAAVFTRLPARSVFVKRAHVLRSIRHFFDTRGYLEVETPMLHTIAGGAAARPFTTHHNALDMPLNLRIAPELYLKRLVVGGLDRVYEINRNFRNEGVSTQHNPEFTMLEFYQAYANYQDLMDLTRELVAQAALDVNGSTITQFNGAEIDLAPENWRQLSMREAIVRFWPEDAGTPPVPESFLDQESLAPFVHRLDASVLPEAAQQKAVAAIQLDLKSERWPVGKSIAELFELIAEPHLIQPTIIYDYPLAVSPLSKPKPDEPEWVERFEFYIGGFEVGNGFSELNDPDDQLRRFEAQLEDRKRGDVEAMAEVDYDYVRALGYGLPPTAGEGIGIDRLTMILTGSRSIRDVILFPLMRPQKQAAETAPEAGHAHGESAE